MKRFILLGVPSVPYLEAMLVFRGDPASARRGARGELPTDLMLKSRGSGRRD